MKDAYTLSKEHCYVGLYYDCPQVGSKGANGT